MQLDLDKYMSRINRVITKGVCALMLTSMEVIVGAYVNTMVLLRTLVEYDELRLDQDKVLFLIFV